MKRAKEGAFRSGIERQHGFSLMELMIVIAIIGVMSAIAIPNILSYRENARLRGAASEMLSTFRKAQVTAVKRNYNTGLVFDAAAGKTTVFLDNGAGALANNSTMDPGEPTLEEFTLPVGCKIPGDPFGGKTGFSPRGLPINIGTIEIHPTSGSSKSRYRIRLSMAGHTKIEVSTDNGSTWK